MSRRRSKMFPLAFVFFAVLIVIFGTIALVLSL